MGRDDDLEGERAANPPPERGGLRADPAALAHHRIIWRGAPRGPRPHWIFGLGALAGLLGAVAGFASLALGYWTTNASLGAERALQPPAIVARADDPPAGQPDGVGAAVTVTNDGGPMREVRVSERAFAVVRVTEPGGSARSALVPLQSYYDEREVQEAGAAAPTLFRGRSHAAADWVARSGPVVARPERDGVLVQLRVRVVLRVVYADRNGATRVAYVEPGESGGKRLSPGRGQELFDVWARLREQGVRIEDFATPLSAPAGVRLVERVQTTQGAEGAVLS